MAKKLSKKLILINAVANFTKTEVYFALIAEIREKGSLPTDKEEISRLLDEAANLAIQKLSEI